jgi:Holliday junction resolvase
MSLRCCIQALADKATAENAIVVVAEAKETDATTLSVDDSEVEKLSKEALLYKQAKTLEVRAYRSIRMNDILSCTLEDVCNNNVSNTIPLLGTLGVCNT